MAGQINIMVGDFTFLSRYHGILQHIFQFTENFCSSDEDVVSEWLRRET
jgi:hypothetical protein